MSPPMDSASFFIENDQLKNFLSKTIQASRTLKRSSDLSKIMVFRRTSMFIYLNQILFMNLFSTFASLRKTVASLSLVTLIAGMFATGVASALTSHVFSDVPADAWFAQYVNGLADMGVIDSTKDMYRPGDLVNRAEMAKFGFMVSGLPLETATAAPFKDVPMGQWYTNYVHTLAKNGIVSGDKANGVPTGWYRPNDALNRAEASKILVNSAQMAEDLSGAPHFPDVVSSAWYYNFVETLFNNGVIQGYPDGMFRPANNINRAEVAKMVYLSMNPATAGFTLDSAAAASLTTVELIFSMNVNEASAEMMANYKILDSTGAALAVSGATMTAPDTVLLTTASQTKGKVYYVTATNVMSAASDALANTDSVSFLGYGADVSGGNLMVSLSTETPVASAVPQGATGVVFTCWDFTGGATASVVKSLTVHRVGPGVETAFDNVYLYNGDARITTGRSINNSTQSVEFSNINQNVGAGQNVKICLVADLSLTSAGGVHAFELANAAAVMSNSSSMTGSFPLRGADQLITTATVGTSTIKKNGSLDEVTVGSLAARVAQFEIAAGSTEDQQLMRIALYVRGSVPVGALQNLKLYVEGNATALASVASVGANDLATLVLATPYKIGKGQTKIFYVTADVVGARNGDDVKIYIDEATDVYIKGITFGYGTQVNILAYDGDDPNGTPGDFDDQFSYVLLKGSKFTIAFNGPVAGDLAVNQKQAQCMTMTLTNAAGLDVTIKDWVVNLTAGNVAGAADGLLDTTAATKGNYTQIQLVRLNADGTVGGVLLGSSELVTVPADSGVGIDLSQDVPLKGTSSIASGESIKAAIVFDIANNTDPSFTNDTIKCSLLAPTGNDQIKDSNNDTLGATNITPSSTTGGNTMTVVSAALTFTKNSSPANFTKIAKGTNNATMLAFQAKAGSALDTTIKSLTVTGDHVASTATATATVAVGEVTGYVVTNGGSGYVVPPVVTVLQSTCTTTPTATAVLTNGVVTSITDDNGSGPGCVAGNTVTIAAPPASTTDIKDLVDSLGIYDSTGTLLSTLKSFPASAVGSNSAVITFNNLSIPVAKNGTVNLFVKGMVSNSIVSAAQVNFFLSATPLVIDSMGQTVTGVDISAIDGTTPFTDSLVTILGSSPTVANAVTAANDPKMFAENQTNPVFAFTLKSTDGNATLQDLTVNLSTTGALLPIDSVALYSATASGACDSGTTLLKNYESVIATSATAGHVNFTNINKSLPDSQNVYFCVFLKSKTVVSGQPVSNTDIVMGTIVFDKVQDQSGAPISPPVATITPALTASIFFKGVPTFTPVTLGTALSNGSEIDVLKFTAGSVGSVSSLNQLVVTFESTAAASLPTTCNIYRGPTGSILLNTAPVTVTDVNQFAFVPGNWIVPGNTPWNNGEAYTVKCVFGSVVAGTSTRAKLAPTSATFASAIIWDDSNGATLTDAAFAAVDTVLFLNAVQGPQLSSII